MTGQTVEVDVGEKGVFFGPRTEEFLEVLLHRPLIIA
jgi:hypothetical protein